MKLKYSEIPVYRSAYLEQQNQRCALCGDQISDDAVLDHDHRTGRLRRVLHRGCNAMLGKIENNMARNKLTIDRLEQFAVKLVSYIKEEYEDIVHPTYKTLEERKMRAKSRGKGRGKGRGR